MLFLQLIDLLLPLFFFFHIGKLRYPPKIFLTPHIYVLLLPGLRHWTIISICWKGTAIFPPVLGKFEEWRRNQTIQTTNVTSIIQIMFKLYIKNSHGMSHLVAHAILSIQRYPKLMENRSLPPDYDCQKRRAKDGSWVLHFLLLLYNMYSMKIKVTNIIHWQVQPLNSPLSTKIILVAKPEEIEKNRHYF